MYDITIFPAENMQLISQDDLAPAKQMGPRLLMIGSYNSMSRVVAVETPFRQRCLGYDAVSTSIANHCCAEASEKV